MIEEYEAINSKGKEGWHRIYQVSSMLKQKLLVCVSECK
jgi:hypothetical protein